MNVNVNDLLEEYDDEYQEDDVQKEKIVIKKKPYQSLNTSRKPKKKDPVDSIYTTYR